MEQPKAAPLTIADIFKRRQQFIDNWKQKRAQQQNSKPATLTDNLGHQLAVNLPADPRVMTIISWNVQKFCESKSLANPYVNKVINLVLHELDADACFLLETADSPSTNLTAIEHALANSESWKDTSEDEDAFAEMDVETKKQPRTVSEIESDADEKLVYETAASEMTGKHFHPPYKIFMYDEDTGRQQRAINETQRAIKLETKKQTKKLTKDEQKTLDSFSKKSQANQTLYAQAMNASKAAVSFASEYTFFPKMKVNWCVDDQTKQRNKKWRSVYLSNEPGWSLLRAYYAVGQVASDYSIVGLPDSSVPGIQDSDERWIVLTLRRCADCNKHMGFGMCPKCRDFGPYSTTLDNIQWLINEVTSSFGSGPQKETYGVLVRPHPDLADGPGGAVYATGKMAATLARNTALLLYGTPPGPLNNATQSGPEFLGFQKEGSKFYGRCPFLMPIAAQLADTGAASRIPIVAFHAPYGDSDAKGVEARADALLEVLNADVGDQVQTTTGIVRRPLGDVDCAVVMGDFNLDYDPNYSGKAQPQLIANKLYETFSSRGFHSMIEGVPTSLTSYQEKGGVWAKHWQSLGTKTSEYTSSAYDNFFVRGQPLVDRIVNGAAIDVLELIAANIADYPLANDDPAFSDFANLANDKQRAFLIYHRFVSDHLPIVCDILVDAMSPSFEEQLKHETARRREELKRTTEVPTMNLLMKYASIENFALVPNDVKLEWDYYIPKMDHRGRIAEVTGTIVGHSESGLQIRSLVAPNQTLNWIVDVAPEHMEQLFKTFPVNVRVQAVAISFEIGSV